MVVINYSREYDLDADAMWKVVSDFADVHKVHPGVAAVELLTMEPVGVGAKRRCKFYDGGHAEEAIYRWDPEKMIYEIHLDNSTVPFKTAVAVFQVECIDSGDNKSKVSVKFNAEVKYWPLGVLMGKVVIKPQLLATFEKMFARFAYYMKTSKEVEKDDTLVTLNAGAA